MRIEGIDDGAIRAAIGEGFGKVARERLGPAIRDSAKAYCPVDTGALRDSITDSYDEASQTLYVTATGSDESTYAAYLEYGHAVYHPSTGIVGPAKRSPKSIYETCAFGSSAPFNYPVHSCHKIPRQR